MMHLISLYLQDYRTYSDAYFEFDPRLNLITGPNAQGKTNLLEAITYLLIGKSFRSHQHQELINHNANSFLLEGKFQKQGVEQKILILCEGKERKIIYNSTTLPSVSSLFGLLQGVVMIPDDIQLIKGSPQLRRQFLDIQMAQADPLYVHHLMRYTRAMRQRNYLLKNKQTSTIENWEHEMAQSAAHLVSQRFLLAKELQELCQTLHPLLTGESSSFQVQYRTSQPQQATLDERKNFQLQQYHKHRTREFVLGYTLTGPHKDDLLISLDEKDIRFFASEGQQRSCLTVLHLAEWQRLSTKSGMRPLMMIDDFGLGLDHHRKKKFLEQLPNLGQVFITCTDSELLNGMQIIPKQFNIMITNNQNNLCLTKQPT